MHLTLPISKYSKPNSTSTITQLEELAEALLNFSSQSDLVNYLRYIFLPQPNQKD
ncbi:DUF4351 domain-containing protein [uncultured Nostoc sp.]|uniref:DUF4351 domain-containing protein n=1 Tax=uncultured Nostoc sp. TaxID=340711 RepID=UPI0026284BE7|nr:DUF4351 domain-containing protein [uncultured Nostoc sp.]